MNPADALRKEEAEIEILKRRFTEALSDKDDEISSLRETMKNIFSNMKDANAFPNADLSIAEFFEMKAELEKYRKLLRESESGERQLLAALKECKSTLKEKEDETKKSKELLKIHEDCVDTATLEKLRQSLEAKNDEENRIIQLNESLQKAIKERDQKIEELRLSLWETETYCETRSSRLKKLNEEIFLSKDREIESLREEKKYLEDTIDSIRKSSAETSTLKEAELERLRKSATNFQDAVKLEDTAISKLQAALQKRERELFNVQKSKEYEIEVKTDELERTKHELGEKVYLLETELQSVKEKTDVALEDKQRHIEDLIRAIDEENRNASAEICAKEEEIGILNKKLTKMEEELNERTKKASSAEDTIKKIQQELCLKQKHHEMEIAHHNSIIESLRNSKEISEQTLNNNIHVLQEKLNEVSKEIIINGNHVIKNEELSKIIQEKELELTKLKNVVNVLEEENKEMESKIRFFKLNLEDKNLTLKKTVQFVDKLENEKKNIEEEVLCLKNELSESRIKNNKYEIALDNMEQSDMKDERTWILNGRNVNLKSVLSFGKENEPQHQATERFPVNVRHEDVIRNLENKIEKYEKEIGILRLRCKEKEENTFSIKTMLEESNKMIINLEAKALKLSNAVELEKDAHTKTAQDMQELFRMNEALLEEVLKFEELQDQQKEKVGFFSGILEEQGDLIKTSFNDRDSRGKKEFQYSNHKERKGTCSNGTMLNNIGKSLFEKAKWNSCKIQEMNRLINQTLTKKNVELKDLREKNEKLQKLLARKEREISSGRDLITSRENFNKEMESFKESKSRMFEEFERDKKELKQSMMKEIATKEGEMQNFIDHSKDALRKKEDIIAGFKQFIQETATKNRLSLTEKDDIIDSMKNTIEVLRNEKENLQKRFKVVNERCSDMKSKVKISEESQLKIEELRNFVTELEYKMKQKDVSVEGLIHDITNERNARNDLETEVLNLKEMLRNEESLAREAEELVRHVTKEKNQGSKKLQEEKERCNNLEGVLAEKEVTIHQEKLKKNELMKENERLQKSDRKLINKLNAKREKLEEFKLVIKEFNDTIAQLKQKLSKTEQFTLVLRERLDLINRETNKKEQEIQKQSQINAKIREQQELSVIKANEFQIQVKELEEELKTVRQELMLTQTLNNDLKESVQRSKASHEILETKVTAHVKETKENDEKRVALEFEVEDLKQAKLNLVSQKEEVERLKNEEIGGLKKELECSTMYLNQREAAINSVVKERDNLIQELGKTIETHKHAAFTMDSYNKSLEQDKKTLLEKSKTLEKELLEQNKENSELKGSLQAAEMSSRFLTENINELKVVKEVLEKKQEEIASLRSRIKEHERLSEQEMENNRRKGRNNEETFLKLCEDYQNLENMLHQKNNALKNAESANNEIRAENKGLKEIVDNTNQMNKDIEKAMIMYKNDAEKLENVVSHLKTDNDFLQEFAQDMEKVKLKLNAAEESLEAKSKELVQLREKLLAETEHNRILENKILDKESLIQEVKRQQENRVKASEKEIKELRIILEERTRDVSLIKVEKNNFEMQKREAEMKIMELTNSLKNEAAFQQTITQRNQELELEIRQIKREKTLELLSPRISSQPQAREMTYVHPADILSERSLEQKVDNIVVDKVRTLHAKKAQLEIELEKERHERVKEHAELARLKAKLAVYNSVQ